MRSLRCAMLAPLCAQLGPVNKSLQAARKSFCSH